MEVLYSNSLALSIAYSICMEDVKDAHSSLYWGNILHFFDFVKYVRLIWYKV